MIPQTELDEINRHDHDMTAEDRPADDNLHDVELSSRIVGNTLIKFIATYRGDNDTAEEFVYETYRRGRGPMSMRVSEWEDKNDRHESLFDAILDAVSYLPQSSQPNEADVLRMLGQMTHEASHNARGAKS